ncbi:M-phase phosphoprotein 8 isoform X1 [Lucilia cuprina]|uniref:M-phase phosphoprotein 8 isoform X1 n=1 Tax=Lucilia cuprina TaxID=7375 RepID=UPI001F058B36|nr:M-phase phosphoprotein 8 isoform X1 [Lucilia cuprina]
MVGKIHKKKISEYTEAAENEDKQSERGDDVEDEMILDHVDPAPSGSESENGDMATHDNNKSLDSIKSNDDDAGVGDVVGTGGLNDDDTDFQLSDADDNDDLDEEKNKKAKKRKASGSKKSGDYESDDEPLNGGTPKKKGRKAPGKGKGGKGKAKAKKPVHDDEDDEEGEEEYEVKDIVDHKTERGVSYFLIRWKGYTKDDDTWEPEDTLNCPDIIERYMKKQKSSPKKGSPAKKKGGKAAGKNKKAKDEDEEQEWEVEKIIDYAEEKKGRVFRIRWKGFGPKNDTWEPEENLNCSDIIQKFLAKMKLQENVSFKELREEPKKTKRLVNETAPRTNINNPIGRKSKRSVTKKSDDDYDLMLPEDSGFDTQDDSLSLRGRNTTAVDESFLRMMLSLMKDVPLSVKNKFQADMFAAIYRIRGQYLLD